MAKSVVRTQMPAMKARTSPTVREMRGPFDKPRTGGDGGSNIPTHTMESMGETPARSVSASFSGAKESGTQQAKSARRYKS